MIVYAMLLNIGYSRNTHICTCLPFHLLAPHHVRRNVKFVNITYTQV